MYLFNTIVLCTIVFCLLTRKYDSYSNNLNSKFSIRSDSNKKTQIRIKRNVTRLESELFEKIRIRRVVSHISAASAVETARHVHTGTTLAYPSNLIADLFLPSRSRYAPLGSRANEKRSKPEKYCAGSRRSAQVFRRCWECRLATRWSGTTARDGGRQENGTGRGEGEGEGGERSRSRRDDGLSRTTSGELVLYNVSLLLISRQRNRASFLSPIAFRARKIATRRRGSGRCVPVAHQVGYPRARAADDDGGRTSLGVHFPRFFFHPPRRYTANRRPRERSIADRALFCKNDHFENYTAGETRGRSRRSSATSAPVRRPVRGRSPRVVRAECRHLESR